MSTFSTEVMRRAGGDGEEVARIAHAALCLLAPWLSGHARNVVLRFGAGAALQPGEDGADSVADLADRVAARARVSRSRAAEVAGVVAAVLADGEQTSRFLAPDAPPDIADLFFGHPQAQQLPRAAPHAPERHLAEERGTLSSANPGSLHPLASAHPTAQRSSVAEPDPHRDSKISSGAGAERTLATGAPKGRALP